MPLNAKLTVALRALEQSNPSAYCKCPHCNGGVVERKQSPFMRDEIIKLPMVGSDDFLEVLARQCACGHLSFVTMNFLQ